MKKNIPVCEKKHFFLHVFALIGIIAIGLAIICFIHYLKFGGDYHQSWKEKFHGGKYNTEGKYEYKCEKHEEMMKKMMDGKHSGMKKDGWEKNGTKKLIGILHEAKYEIIKEELVTQLRSKEASGNTDEIVDALIGLTKKGANKEAIIKQLDEIMKAAHKDISEEEKPEEDSEEKSVKEPDDTSTNSREESTKE